MSNYVDTIACALTLLAVTVFSGAALSRDYSEGANIAFQGAEDAAANNKEFCRMWAPSDEEARADCILGQSDGYARVIAIRDAAMLKLEAKDPIEKATGGEILGILDACLHEWSRAGLIEYRMVAYCSETEIENHH